MSLQIAVPLSAMIQYKLQVLEYHNLTKECVIRNGLVPEQQLTFY